MAETEFAATGSFELHVEQRAVMQMAAPGVEGYVLGRTDAASSYMPDVNLADFRALEHGVSRRHAALVRYRGRVHIVDLSSVNGTFLNGERLQPDKPYPLRPGDILRLGTLNMSLIKIK
ncbi:MAG: FHA domain-containing protein [Anaerolineae bacterium]|nr:FHA domain-containing protein [Anaerolineae bacterium]